MERGGGGGGGMYVCGARRCLWCVHCFAWLIVVVIVVLFQTTRGLLHKASITGDCNTARALLEIGVDVDQRDQVVIYFLVHLFICLTCILFISQPCL